jgi:ribonucleoside-diphosphate reductase alpha chain
MQIGQNDPAGKPARKTLSTRRFNRSLPVECEGHTYRATAGWFDDGQLAEIFLDTGKFGTALQANADTAAILTSLLLQHGVSPDVILHSISGPIAIALRLFMEDAP